MKALDGALWQRFTDSQALRNLGVTAFRRHHATRGDVPPYVIFGEQSQVRTYVLSRLAYIDLVYNIKAVQDGGSAITAQDISEAIDALLTDTPFPVDGFQMTYIRSESGFELDDITAGQSFDMIGLLFRIHLEPIPMATPRLASKITLANA